MNEHQNQSFGHLLRELRAKKGWTVKQFIEALQSTGKESISPAYVTRIEQYDEVPTPGLICRIADVFRYNIDELIALAKETKKKKFEENLDEKYQKAVGLYRLQRRKR